MCRYDWSNIMPKFFGLQVLLRGKGIKLVCPAHRVIQWYMRYVGFKPQILRNAKWNYHCSGPLELYLYIQICTILAKFLVLMFLHQIYRTQNKKKRTWGKDIHRLSHQRSGNLDVIQMVPRNHGRQVLNVSVTTGIFNG